MTTDSGSQIEQFYPRLVVEGADKALDFYAAILHGEIVERFDSPAGRVQHAMVVAGPARIAVKDAGDGDPAPAGDGQSVIFALYVEDADAVAAAMVERGAEVIFPVSDHAYGERAGRLRDPWGHQWMVAEHPA